MRYGRGPSATGTSLPRLPVHPTHNTVHHTLPRLCESNLGAISTQRVHAHPHEGTIHGDFEKFFIKAEVYNYDDFKEHGGEKECKAAGKVREQGKAYVCKDGDIMFFKHNAK